WVLETLLGTPPPPPPANVPPLPDRNEKGRPASVRERLEAHRKNPACAVCHTTMDPLGFALENFDAIGEWRTASEDGTPIDASGAMPGSVQFEGPAGLRVLMLSRRDQVIGNVLENPLAYALGRSVEYYDMPAIRTIVRGAATTDYRWSSLILGIVRSAPFRTRRALFAEKKPTLVSGQ